MHPELIWVALKKLVTLRMLTGPKSLNPKYDSNSSIVEQTNVWLGGYHAIVREMLPVKYNFFLDEMVMHRNHTLRMD